MTKPMEFHVSFQISRLVIFDVDWYTLGNNEEPYFATSAMKYVRSKRGCSTCGQCQGRVLTGEALKFWEKWDRRHLAKLDSSEVAELLSDLDALAGRYNYVAKFSDAYKGGYSDISSTEHYRLSMQRPKR